MADLKAAKLCYTDGGRGGTIHYTSPETSFDMWYELAMAPALVIMGIPESKNWEGQTKNPLAQREDTLRCIGQQVIDDKLSGNGYFLFDDQTMTIHSGRKPDAV